MCGSPFKSFGLLAGLEFAEENLRLASFARFVQHIYLVRPLEYFDNNFTIDVVAREPPFWFRAWVQINDAIVALKIRI